MLPACAFVPFARFSDWVRRDISSEAPRVNGRKVSRHLTGRSFSSLVQSVGWPVTRLAMQHTGVFVIRTDVSGSQTQLAACLGAEISPRSRPICGANHQIIYPPKSRAVHPLLSRLPSFSEGDRWTRVAPRAPWAPPHLEPATSLLAHASADHCSPPLPPVSVHRCQTDAYAEGTYV